MYKYPRVSELLILESAAGYYIGRVYKYSDDDFEPYSRDSNYFQDRDIAEMALIENSYIERFDL